MTDTESRVTLSLLTDSEELAAVVGPVGAAVGVDVGATVAGVVTDGGTTSIVRLFAGVEPCRHATDETELTTAKKRAVPLEPPKRRMAAPYFSRRGLAMASWKVVPSWRNVSFD
jgi:hypothetical protein